MQNDYQLLKGLRVALVGAGNICQTGHIPTLHDLGVPIVSVTDPSQAALDDVRRLLPSSVELINSSEGQVSPDAICAIVCSPPALHAKQVASLFDQGLDVLCEKPLASSFLDAQAVAEIAREKKRILQVGYFRRFHPAAHAIRALLRNGDLGEPCRCVINAGHIIASPSPLLMNLQLSGGGVVMDFGVHVIDRLVSWFDRIELAEYADDAMGEMEANALIRMRGWVDQSAIEVEARFSRTSQLGYFGTVEFEEGSVDFELNAGHSLIMRGSRQVRILDHDCPMSGELRLGPPFRGGGYFRQQFLEFAARVHGSSETWSCLSDAVQVNALVDECYAHKSALQTVYGD